MKEDHIYGANEINPVSTDEMNELSVIKSCKEGRDESQYDRCKVL